MLAAGVGVAAPVDRDGNILVDDEFYALLEHGFTGTVVRAWIDDDALGAARDVAAGLPTVDGLVAANDVTPPPKPATVAVDPTGSTPCVPFAASVTVPDAPLPFVTASGLLAYLDRIADGARIPIVPYLKSALDDDARARLLEIAEKCPVNRTLKSEIDIRGTIHGAE